MMTRLVVLGIGNLLNCDEGVGVHAVRQLQQLNNFPPGVEIIDGGTLGLNLLPLVVEEATHLVLLDAVDAGQAPGTVIELRKDEIPLYSGIKMSQHQVTFQEVLGLALIRNRLPEHLHLIGIQPKSLAIGTDLSDVVATALPEMLDRTRRILQEWLTVQE
ncbi:MAG: hydrogenase maturation protease [Chloroflexi bacterium]|nr:hydrogenase maturation protease [Chloroflexota bacterium]